MSIKRSHRIIRVVLYSILTVIICAWLGVSWTIKKADEMVGVMVDATNAGYTKDVEYVFQSDPTKNLRIYRLDASRYELGGIVKDSNVPPGSIYVKSFVEYRGHAFGECIIERYEIKDELLILTKKSYFFVLNCLSRKIHFIISAEEYRAVLTNFAVPSDIRPVSFPFVDVGDSVAARTR